MIKSRNRRQKIAAAPAAVRLQTPAHVRWATLAILLVAALILSWGMYAAGRNAGIPDRIEPPREERTETGPEMERLSQSNARLQHENDELRIKMAGLDQQLQMDQAARQDIASQVKTLQGENTRLKEELAFFQNLGSAPGKTGQRVSIGGLKLEKGKLPGEYRYSLLLVQSGVRGKDFHGNLEFAVNFQQNGEKMVQSLTSNETSDDDPSKKFDVSFRFYRRVESTFWLAPDAIVDSLQVKVFEKGETQARLMQTVNLSL
ncbi:hypothetical protein C8R21_11640 [Nitrosospira multiformis]|uniref:Uncharacterized protein n=1 Tax=Nitrosospira multiformis TaxID=1231 RepID=A0A2T5I9A5_9PROT|nr:DUF6776 family protein [Nitrosospira multiformis]PTQ80409.1 hypothetical protein C8R21_11640 [Nitrosospira multiformis]